MATEVYHILYLEALTMTPRRVPEMGLKFAIVQLNNFLQFITARSYLIESARRSRTHRVPAHCLACDTRAPKASYLYWYIVRHTMHNRGTQACPTSGGEVRRAHIWRRSALRKHTTLLLGIKRTNVMTSARHRANRLPSTQRVRASASKSWICTENTLIIW